MSVGILVLAILMVIFLFLLLRRKAIQQAPEQSPETYVERMGQFVKADEAFKAWNSLDLDKMVKAVAVRTNPIDRHFLLQTIVQETYKQRDKPAMRTICKEIGELHVSEFGNIAPALKEDMGGFLPRVSTFQHLATVLSEDQEYDHAIEICKTALQYGLHDGTKGGFEGRILSIKKKVLPGNIVARKANSGRVGSNKQSTISETAQALKSEMRPPELKTISLTAEKVSQHGKARFRLPNGLEGFVEEVALYHLRSEGWEGIWGENQVWWALMALFFWDVIFTRIEGVWHPEFGDFPSKMQDMPQDFFRPEFFARRERLIADRLKALESADLNQELLGAYSAHHGKPCRPIENWERFSLSDLQNVARYIPKAPLLAILHHLLKDFNENRRGLPDLFIWRNSEYAFVEVKGPGDGLSKNQEGWFNVILEVGVTIIVLNVALSGSDN